MTGYISSFVCNSISLPYPIFASFKAIESSDKNDDTQWLTFWVVWACIVLFESMTDIFIFWIPLYFELKLGFFLLLQAPILNLSEKLYQWYIKPYLIQKRLYLDQIFTNLFNGLLMLILRIPSMISYNSSKTD